MKCKNCGKEMVLKFSDNDTTYTNYKYETYHCPYCDTVGIVTYKKDSEKQFTVAGTKL